MGELGMVREAVELFHGRVMTWVWAAANEKMRPGLFCRRTHSTLNCQIGMASCGWRGFGSGLQVPMSDELFYLLFLFGFYATTVVTYFALGHGLTWVNDRNPERKIQKGRGSDKRRKAEIRQSLASMFSASLPLAIGLYAQQKGWAPAPWAFNWWAAVPLFVLCLFLYDSWFYFMHRLLHTKWLYPLHALHHKSIAPTIWSTYSEDVFDNFLLQGFSAVIVFAVPFPPTILIGQRLFEHFNGMFGHCGFEYFASSTARYPSPLLCTTFHDQHHSGFRYNYGNYFSFWDRVLGTISPNYDHRVKTFEQEGPALKFSQAIYPPEVQEKPD
ncbi:sterol desaturase family protein [Sinorhizobium sp. 8-89]|uniref:sterol desaturase family protein n=1 Tax=Sinorhizobium sp. 7-81 TaxID=3049087 RepID=UPI0024C272E7|nr:sterol desaturase family protein [Sinorhizobium sp. 7-81]MDK1384179.1 sterol desaturase family protein [Sinorhizobium sp. 7-81]